MKWYWLLAAGIVLIGFILHTLRLVRFDTTQHWTVWLVAGLVLLNGGWMAFDGARALAVGDYVTPKTGPRAGLLGPWSKVVETVGIGPRSTTMKTIFLVYGLLYLVMAAALVLGASWGRWGLVVAPALGVWYIPFGMVINVIVIVLLMSSPLRS